MYDTAGIQKSVVLTLGLALQTKSLPTDRMVHHALVVAWGHDMQGAKWAVCSTLFQPTLQAHLQTCRDNASPTMHRQDAAGMRANKAGAFRCRSAKGLTDLGCGVIHGGCAWLIGSSGRDERRGDDSRGAAWDTALHTYCITQGQCLHAHDWHSMYTIQNRESLDDGNAGL